MRRGKAVHRPAARDGAAHTLTVAPTEQAGLLADHQVGTRLAALVAAIGRDRFDQALADLLVAAGELDQCNVIAFTPDRQARCLYAWNRRSPADANQRVRRYVEERHFRQDPILTRLWPQGRRRRSAGMLHRDQIADTWYRRFFYDELRLGGKLAVLQPMQGEGVFVNYYSGAARAFSQRERDNLTLLSDLVAQCVLRHHELRPTAGAPDLPTRLRQVLAHTAPHLSVREREVCTHIVAGSSAEAIATNLGVATSSVTTYRRRAYAKLGITCRHQLFALCLETAGPHRPPAARAHPEPGPGDRPEGPRPCGTSGSRW